LAEKLSVPQHAPRGFIGLYPADKGVAQNMSEMKFVPFPGMPTCASGAVAKGDPGKADQKMRDHVTYGMEEVLRRLEPVLGWNGSRILAFTKPRLKK